MKDDKQGWIPIHRKLQNHWLWEEKPFSKGQAWIDILLLANHKDAKTLLGNELIEVKCGSFVTSEVKLAERWGWGRTKVRAFLKLLEQDEMIFKKNEKKRTVIIVENYSSYANQQTIEKQSTNNRKTVNKHLTNNRQTFDKQSTNINNNVNNDKQLKKDITNVISKERPRLLGEFENVSLSEEELEKLKVRFPYDWQERIESLSNYMKSKGKRYKSHYATILAWARRDEEKKAASKKSPAEQLDEFYSMAGEWAKGESDE